MWIFSVGKQIQIGLHSGRVSAAKWPFCYSVTHLTTEDRLLLTVRCTVMQTAHILRPPTLNLLPSVLTARKDINGNRKSVNTRPGLFLRPSFLTNRLTGHFLNTSLPFTAHWLLYIYHQVKHQQFFVLPTQCICVDLRTNSDYFPIQH
jgi:hypothetical protein